MHLFIHVLGFILQYISTASWVREMPDYNIAAQVSELSQMPLLSKYFCKFFFGNRYPKLFVPKNGQILNIALQVSDESHEPLVLISSRKKIQKSMTTRPNIFSS